MIASKKMEASVQSKVDALFCGNTHPRPQRTPPVSEDRRARAAAMMRSVANGAASASVYSRDVGDNGYEPEM